MIGICEHMIGCKVRLRSNPVVTGVIHRINILGVKSIAVKLDTDTTSKLTAYFGIAGDEMYEVYECNVMCGHTM